MMFYLVFDTIYNKMNNIIKHINYDEFTEILGAQSL